MYVNSQFVAYLTVTFYCIITSSALWDDSWLNVVLRTNPPKSGTDVYVDITVTDVVIPVNAMQETEWTIYLRQVWFDQRLVDSKNASSDQQFIEPDRFTIEESMWLPDIHFPNALTVKTFDSPSRNSVYRIYRNGTAYWSSRMTVTVGCPMEEYKFPFNSYVCTIKLQSYGNTEDIVRLDWSVNFIPIKMKTEPASNGYVFDKVEKIRNIEDTDIGNMSSLEAKFQLTRIYRMYLIQVYMPSGLLVALSWLAFWIDRTCIAARVSLGSLCVVSIITQASGLLAILPFISGIRAIDVWEATCICMIFLAMLEFATMHFMCRMKVKHDEYVRIRKEGQTDDHEENNTDRTEKESRLDALTTRMIGRYRYILGLRTNPARIDNVSRVLFPLAFLIFNLIYWPYYIYN